MMARFVRSAALGALAGAAGTAAMDALWYRRACREGSTDGPMAWEFARSTTTWDDVSAPGKLGRLALQKLTASDPPDQWARPTQNIVHWATGILWGVQYGSLLGAVRRPRSWWGLGLGASAWAASYAVLPKLGVYQPIWEYDTHTLTKDLSAHLVYGAAAGLTYTAARRATGGAS